MNCTLPKQPQKSRSILKDGSRFLGLFWKENIPSYNRKKYCKFMTISPVYILVRSAEGSSKAAKAGIKLNGMCSIEDLEGCFLKEFLSVQRSESTFILLCR